MNTGHFERKFIDEDIWEYVTEGYILSKGTSPETVEDMKNNPGSELRLNPFAFYRWVSDLA
jgi:hypothetical protein